MATYEDGYLQALFDLKAVVRARIGETDAPPSGQAELLCVTSLLDELIRNKIEQLVIRNKKEAAE